MTKALRLSFALLAMVLLSSASFSCLSAPISRYEETRDKMGTYVKVVVYADAATAEAAIEAAFDRIDEINAVASRYDPTSELSQLNADGSIDSPSAELLELVQKSIEYYEMSDGFFDVTCLPLLDLWGSTVGDQPFYMLSSEAKQAAIDDVLPLIGSDMINVSADEISFDKEGMSITLDAIAKGYAVDKALQAIEDEGVKYALIDAGGDIGTLGSKPNAVPWTVSLVNPDDTTEMLDSFDVKDKAVATSGNYERYFDPEGEAGHVLNPKTGYSVQYCISSTIITDNCTDADALATSVMVLGWEDGLELVDSLDGVEALVVDADREMHRSSGLT